MEEAVEATTSPRMPYLRVLRHNLLFLLLFVPYHSSQSASPKSAHCVEISSPFERAQVALEVDYSMSLARGSALGNLRREIAVSWLIGGFD